jgi:hypothetical protein
MKKRKSNSQGCFITIVSRAEVEDDRFYVDLLGWHHYFGRRIGMAAHKKGPNPRGFGKFPTGYIEGEICQRRDQQRRIQGKENGFGLIEIRGLTRRQEQS